MRWSSWWTQPQPGWDVDAELQPVPAAFVQALRELGLAGDEALRGQPLTGGVSSDIWRIDTARGPVCAKRALAKLRVAADWHAPIERNQYEARWMQVAQAAQPGCTPQLLGQHPGLGVLVMQWLAPADHRLWKAMLRAGQADTATAQAVGRTLAHMHAHAAARSPPSWRRCSTATRSSSTSGSSPICWPPRSTTPTSRRACRRWWRRRRRTSAHAGARRRQPEEHPGRPVGPGAAGRRMRLVGRPGLRPGVLPEPPAAEMPVDAGDARRLPGCLRGAGRRLPGRRGLGAA
jgi:hypothetical protein